MTLKTTNPSLNQSIPPKDFSLATKLRSFKGVMIIHMWSVAYEVEDLIRKYIFGYDKPNTELPSELVDGYVIQQKTVSIDKHVNEWAFIAVDRCIIWLVYIFSENEIIYFIGARGVIVNLDNLVGDRSALCIWPIRDGIFPHFLKNNME